MDDAVANRAAFLDEVARAPFGRGAAVSLIQIRYAAGPRLKTTAVSDRVAAICARAIAALVPPECALFRTGDDTFAVVARDSAGRRAVRYLVRQVCETFLDPLRLPQGDVVVKPVVGFAAAADDATDGEHLVAQARTALDLAAAEQHSLVEFTDKLGAQAERFASIDRHLRGAVADGELDLRYQPIVSAANGRLVGMEALLRWHSRALGAVPAHEFIPVAERSGYIEQLGEWVFRRAFADYTSWNLTGACRPRLMVNISPAQLVQRNFYGTFSSAAAAVGMDLCRVDLELTETAVTMDWIRTCSPQLQQFRDRGVRVSLDDFGAGYSSLSCIAALPLDVVKLDHSLVQALLRDPLAESVAAAMIAFAHQRGISVVGEGVELPELAAKLTAMDCDAFQGFLVARPMPARAAYSYITANAHRPAVSAAASARKRPAHGDRGELTWSKTKSASPGVSPAVRGCARG